MTLIVLITSPARLHASEVDEGSFRALKTICFNGSKVDFHTSARISACTKLIHSDLGTRDEHAAIYEERGMALDLLGEPTVALNDFTEALRLKPDNQSLLRRRAYFYLHAPTRDVPRAFADLDRLVRTWPSDPTVFEARADAYQSSGDARRAAADFEVARRLRGLADPDRWSIYHNSGYFHFLDHDYASAIDDLSVSIASAPEKFPETFLTRGQSYLAVGDPRRALLDFDSLLETWPWREDAQQLRTEALYALGRRGEALLERTWIWTHRTTQALLFPRDPREAWVRPAVATINEHVPPLTPYSDELYLRCDVVSWVIWQRPLRDCYYILPIPRPL